jgi:hypothetical protein
VAEDPRTMLIKLADRLHKYGSRFGLFWKSSIVLLGLPAIYLIVQKSLWQGIGLVGIIIILTIFSNKKSAPALRDKKDLFKDCC